jgi:ribosomal protein S18 acetylase RimI-like enzyme
MEIREATADDRTAVMGVMRRSLEASYSLSPATIEGAVEEWYGPTEYEERLERGDTLILVGETDTVVAFSESVVVADGGQADLLWLHVHPGHRGRDIGIDLFEATEKRLTERGAAYLRGRVLSDNQTGASFYEMLGFEQVDEDHVEIGGEQYVEYIYSNAVSRQLQSFVTEDGEVVYVDMADEEVGSDAPFNVVLSDPNGEARYGYFCSHCERPANAMSANGRIKCDGCGNTRKPTRWDASYL